VIPVAIAVKWPREISHDRPSASRAVRESRDSARRKAGRNTTAEVIQFAS
jgi:hypothetical protein